MIAATDIKDSDSLRQWLEEWPKSQGMDVGSAQKVAVSIAHRAAMRVFPNAWEWFSSEAARKRDLTALPFLRLYLISGVASTCPTPEISFAADAATNAADAANVWGEIAEDALQLEAGVDLSTRTLWSAPPPRLVSSD